MNIRKNIDYSEMYKALDILMQKNLPQMELYCGIGRAVCQRTEKGAAVMASEYLNEKYPDVKGFSPRSLRRMRDFYRTYENHPTLLSRALNLGWIQNVVIMEAELTMELREWYMKAAKQFGWSKSELTLRIAEQVHMEINLNREVEVCDTIENDKEATYFSAQENILCVYIRFAKCPMLPRCRGRPKIRKYSRILAFSAIYGEMNALSRMFDGFNCIPLT